MAAASKKTISPFGGCDKTISFDGLGMVNGMRLGLAKESPEATFVHPRDDRRRHSYHAKAVRVAWRVRGKAEAICCRS